MRLVFDGEGEIVAQVVETEFVVGCVRNVSRISRAFLFGRLAGLRYTDGQAQEFIDRAHPVSVALRQVFVDGHDVHAIRAKRIKVRRQRRHQRLAFTSAHFSNIAVVKHHAADELYVERTQMQGSDRRLAGDRKSLGQQLFERLSVGIALAEFFSLGPKVAVGKRLQPFLERVDLLNGF